MNLNNPKYKNLTKPDYSKYSITQEILNLREFLKKENLWLPESFFAQIRQGDVIDLYTNPPEMRQLYCNSEFKRLCSYTEEQMKNTAFTKLFWRSDEVQLKLIQKASEVALKGTESVRWDIENHELIESLHPQKRTFEIDLGSVSPCFSVGGNERVAFVSSLRVSFVFEWPDFEAA